MVEHRLPARYLIGVELLLCQNMVSYLYLPGMIPAHPRRATGLGD